MGKKKVKVAKWIRNLQAAEKKLEKSKQKDIQAALKGDVPGQVALGYHFSDSEVMARGDGRKIVQGKTYLPMAHKKIVHRSQSGLCGPALHASPEPYYALQHVHFHTAKVLSFVLIRGVVGHDLRKFAGYSREHLKVIKLSPTQRCHLAYYMGGSGMIHKNEQDRDAAARTAVNIYLRGLLGNPEIFPKG